jgi:hypothetical protein
MSMWTGFVWLREDAAEGFCEHGTEHYGSIKDGARLLASLERVGSYLVFNEVRVLHDL